jgi:hypothetical protein
MSRSTISRGSVIIGAKNRTDVPLFCGFLFAGQILFVLAFNNLPLVNELFLRSATAGGGELRENASHF